MNAINKYKVEIIDSVDDTNFKEITMGFEWEKLKAIKIEIMQDTLDYLEYLVLGQHVFRLTDYVIYDEDCSGLYLLVRSDHGVAYENDDDIMRYSLFPLRDELWALFPREQQLLDGDEELLQAIENVGVLPIQYAHTQTGIAFGTAKAANSQ